MTTWKTRLLPMALILPLAGCGALLDFLTPSTYTVRFVNESEDYEVDLTLATAEDEDTPEELLRLLGDERSISVGAVSTVVRTLNCDDAGALMIEDAELQSPLLRPDTSSDVIRRSEDFSCGGTVVFTFTHSALLTDFSVSTDTSPL